MNYNPSGPVGRSEAPEDNDGAIRQRRDRERLAQLENRVRSLETNHLGIRLTIAVVLLLGGLVTPALTWPYERHSWAGDWVEAEPVHLITAGFTYWRFDWMSSQDEWVLMNVGFSIATLMITATLLFTVVFLTTISSRNVGALWAKVGKVTTVLLCVGLAWMALLVFATGGHYTAGKGLYMLFAGAVAAVITVFGMRRYWDQGT